MRVLAVIVVLLAEWVPATIGTEPAAIVWQSYPWSCGPAALSMLLEAAGGATISEQTLISDVLKSAPLKDVEAQGGVSLLALKQAAAAHGYRALALGDLTVAELAARTPALVAIRTAIGAHFVVVIGIEKPGIEVLDPASGRRSIPRSSFETIWVQHAALVLQAPAQLKRV